MPDGPNLSRFERIGWELWLAPAVAAAVWGVLVARAGGDVVLARSLVFVGGPVVLLAGLFERLGSYLHAPQRRTLLPLPLPPRAHFAAAARPHRIGMLLCAGLGTAALSVALLADLGRAAVPAPTIALVLGDWLWLVVMATLTEPAIAAASAWFGRRFEEDTPARLLQRQAGGGWTLPEAVVHLYAPALGVGTAALLAMPGQLTLDRIADAGANAAALRAVSPGLWTASLAPVAIALGLRLWARPGYATGMFEATAWLHQAMRTLAGPPVPEPAPAFIARMRQPALRLWALQLWRVTPIPSVRMWGLLIAGAWIGWAGALGLPGAAVLGALIALWLVPAVRVATLRPGRAAYLAALPLGPAERAGVCRSAAVLLAMPVVLAVALAAGGTVLQGGAP
ncbi:MAG: hypothetical protein AAF721_15360 [Myxococcota bacterium]